jgi:dihydroorotase
MSPRCPRRPISTNFATRPPDELVPLTATTTYVSAGDAGGNNFSGFKHWVIDQSRTRIFAFVHISNIGLAGFPVGEMLNIDYADVDLAAKTVAENREIAIGLKVRESENVVGSNGLEPLKRAIQAAEMAGTGARVMCHIGGAPGQLSELLDLLRPGDILTHTYIAAPATTSSRTARSCPQRSKPSGAGCCSTSAMAAAASTTPSPNRRSIRV